MTRKDVVVSLLIGIIIAVSFAAAAVLWTRANEISTQISCSTAESNYQQLTALAQIAHRLGIPQDFVITEVPAECDGR